MSELTTKNLMNYFNISRDKALEIMRYRKEHCQINPYKFLKLIDSIIGGYGIESIHNRLFYVNTGDTYSNTVLYDYRRNDYRITTWGDYYEHSKYYKIDHKNNPY